MGVKFYPHVVETSGHQDTASETLGALLGLVTGET
jgi:hypothetical protein